MDWKDRLEDVDDDYLIGLSNKGIVKRAYKDKEEVKAEIGDVGEEASVKVGTETVTVRFPLGESKCTCPSRSMCRHVVQAILVLRESCMKEGSGVPEGGAQDGGTHQGGGLSGDGDAAGNGNAGQEEGVAASGSAGQGMDGAGNGNTAQSGDTAGTGKAVPAGEASSPEAALLPEVLETESGPAPKDSAQGGESRMEAAPRTAKAENLGREVNAYSLTALKKILGTRQLQNFVNLAKASIKPAIRYASVITVELPLQEFGEKTVVKLLSPLEYSSCTCHKKELCVHKAAAILWCQLESGVLTKDGLDMLWNTGENGDGPVYDMDKVRDAAGQMKTFLEELLATGLSRTSPDALDYLERLAIISHNAGLARFEGYFRALSDSYDRYFKRKAAFKTEELMAQTARLYRRVSLLMQAKDGSEVLRQAGEFRADYLPAGNLDLIGITMERFQTPTGYEGETIYFLEETSKKWYTYTNARPMFYEPGKRRGRMEKSQAPWGVNLSLEELLKVRIHLTGAKCDPRRRLSSSQETKGEVTGTRRLELSDLEGWFYEDFEKLYREQVGKPGKWLMDQEEAGEGMNLVCVQPESCAKAEFSRTGQQLSVPIYDKAGREMLVEVEYSKRESGTIKYLERIVEKKTPCFLGKLYLLEGRMRMYPVDVWEKFG